MRTHWDEETDVIVVGYGLAGAVAAINAHDAGVDVMILEKGRYPGGLSIFSGGIMIGSYDADAANKYLLRTSGGRVDTALVNLIAHEMVGLEQYLRELAEVNNAKLNTKNLKDRPATYFGGSGHNEWAYPFEGWDSFYIITVAQIPGFKGRVPWAQPTRSPAVNLMKIAMDNVKVRQIKVRFSSPAKRLVTDKSGTVMGTIFETAGKEIAVRARRAVILSCGGFEQNQWLHKQYFQGMPYYSMAPLTHTGDGLIMAQKVGAALWHMWHIHGSYGFKFPEFNIAFRHPLGGSRNPKHLIPWIVVDKLGRRYMNEYHPAPADTNHRPMEIFDPDIPGYPRIPSYMIFDELGRKQGPIARPRDYERVYKWSKDNMKEVKKGWIMKEHSLRDLAQRIAITEDNENMMKAENLEATIFNWNSVVRSGKDQLNRPAGTMTRIETAPFYAVPVWPIITNTQGGPVHNAKRQVIDAFGSPIPRLYTAGELGSFWAHLYLLGGNLSECIWSGRIAGINAARESIC
ncbi:FAD-dependent oxidoreductase [Thermodesulfobacteriota bacterium]